MVIAPPCCLLTSGVHVHVIFLAFLVVWVSVRYYASETVNTPFTLQAVSPVVTRVLGKVPDLGLLSDVHVRPCKSMENRPLSCTS